ncbi:MAG: spondin domain-containing protein [SAR324 cluster bacterium]|nr:spondin domain-containing protein [SAR324 cluster bacterium]
MKFVLLMVLGIGVTVLQGACAALQGGDATTFKVTIANVTQNSPVETVISTGVAFTHNRQLRLFQAGKPDNGMGLEGIAEDGNKWGLNSYLKKRAIIYDRVIFDVPVGQTNPENIGAGKRYEFYIAASPANPYLSLATMVGFTNDLIFALDTDGISGFSLFRPDGSPKSDEELADVANHWDVWDVGTEINEPNGLGPNQPDAPSGLNVGPEDVGIVQIYEDVAHPLDNLTQALEVRVVNKPGAPAGTIQVVLKNLTDQPGATATSFTGLLAVAHGPTLTLFDQGLPEPGMGLESLAEDGDPSTLIETLRHLPGYSSHTVAPGALAPGKSVTLELLLDANYSHVSIAAMCTESNDVFVSFLNPFGQSGLDVFGKTDAEISSMVGKFVRFMDAGTEANEPIGSGKFQAPRQQNPDSGLMEKGTVRRYRIPSDPIVVSDITTITITRATDVRRTVRQRSTKGQGARY